MKKTFAASIALAALLGAFALPGAWSSQTGANPQVVAPLVRFAFALEKDALYHQSKSPAKAKQELDSAAAVLGQALALGPSAPVAKDLREALKFDQFAAGLVLTVNQDKVRLDITSALNRKEAALKGLGQPLAGPFVPAKAVKPTPKPPPAPAKKAKKPKRVSRSKIVRFVEQAGIDEVLAATGLDSGFGRPTVEAYNRLYAAQALLAQAIRGASADPDLPESVVVYLRSALEADLDLINGTWIGRPLGSLDGTLSSSIEDKAEALRALGVSPLVITPITATFDPARLATVYSVEVVRDLQNPFSVPDYTWTLTLKLIDPKGSSPPGFQSKVEKPEPPELPYASAAYDPTCNNSILPGGEQDSASDEEAVHEWKNYGVNPFVWYHGDVGLYREEPGYGCDHRAMGARGHQGTVDVRVNEGVWTCRAGIEGTNLTPTPVEGSEPYCGAWNA